MCLSNKKLFLLFLLVLPIIFVFSSCGKEYVYKPRKARVTGVASWYGPGFHGRTTANGEKYNQNALTAAHRKLPFGTRVKVVNLKNKKEVIVRINDRGPYVRGRVIDLSKAAANRLDFIKSGITKVSLEIVPKKMKKVIPAPKKATREGV